MAWPEYITTRTITAGGVLGLETGSPLPVTITVRASRSLIWQATGFRFEVVGASAQGIGGEEASVTLPTTDIQGWMDGATKQVIDASADGSYTHQYTATVRAGDKVYNVGPFILPLGDGSPVDLDMLIDAGTIPAQTVAIPDAWTEMLLAAQEAAENGFTQEQLDDSIAAYFATHPAGGATINDAATTSTTQTWSANKISAEMGAKLSSVGLDNIDATGTPDDSTFLRGDGVWAAPLGGSGGEGTWGTIGGDIASQSDLAAALEEKADATIVDAALNLKANAADVTTALSAKANTADVTAALSAKANAATAVQYVAVATGSEARPTGAAMVFWIDQRSGTATQPSNMSIGDVWLAPVGGTSGSPTVTAPTITTTALGTLTVGTPLSQPISATGTSPFTWSVTAGALPSGLSLNTSTGTVSGTPDEAGAYTFTLQAANSAGSDTQEFTGTVASTTPASAVLEVGFEEGSGTTFTPTVGTGTGTVGAGHGFYAAGGDALSDFSLHVAAGASIEARSTITQSLPFSAWDGGTISFWFSQDSGDWNRYLFATDSTGADFLGVRINADESASIYFNKTYLAASAAATVPTAWDWGHIALTWDGETVALYVNGVQVASEAQPSTPSDAASISILGAAEFLVDDLRVHTFALSAGQIADLMTSAV